MASIPKMVPLSLRTIENAQMHTKITIITMIIASWSKILQTFIDSKRRKYRPSNITHLRNALC